MDMEEVLAFVEYTDRRICAVSGSACAGGCRYGQIGGCADSGRELPCDPVVGLSESLCPVDTDIGDTDRGSGALHDEGVLAQHFLVGLSACSGNRAHTVCGVS